MSDSKLVYLLSGAAAGVLLTMLSTALYWTSYERQVRLQAITLSIADQTSSLVPLLISVEDQNLEDLSVAARNALIAGIAIMDANVDSLDDDQREIVLPVLESIAAKRSRMMIGQYATPPQSATEQILAKYDR